MEPTSTDKRIDDLSGRVGRFEANVDRRFERFEDKVDARFDGVVTKEMFDKVDEANKATFEAIMARFDRVDARFDRWGKVIGGGVATIAVAVVVKVLGVA
jgi:hypothetical protein